jgi:hypothetical protein
MEPSSVNKFFSKLSGSTKAQCLLCLDNLEMGERKTTSSLINHIEKFHKIQKKFWNIIDINSNKLDKNENDKDQDKVNPFMIASIAAEKKRKKQICKHLLSIIISHYYPFSMVEH